MMPLKAYALNPAVFTVQPFSVNRPVPLDKHFSDAPALVQLFLHSARPLPVRDHKSRGCDQRSGPAVMPPVYRVPVKIAELFCAHPRHIHPDRNILKPRPQKNDVVAFLTHQPHGSLSPFCHVHIQILPDTIQKIAGFHRDDKGLSIPIQHHRAAALCLTAPQKPQRSARKPQNLADVLICQPDLSIVEAHGKGFVF